MAIMGAQHQHYVPQLLLRGFLSRDPARAKRNQVHVLDLVEQKTFTPPTTKIMGETSFNDFWVDEHNRASIEPAATKLETHVAPLVKRIRRQKGLERTAEEFAKLSLLIAFQFIRTKQMRLLPERLNKQIADKVTRMGMDPAEVEGLINWDESELKQQHLNHQLESLNDYAAIIAQKEFFVMTAPESHSFYIGDQPVVLKNDKPQTLGTGHLGIGAPFIQIYLPLSSDVMLCAYDKAVLGELMMRNDDGLKEIQMEALAKVRNRQLTGSQMKAVLDAGRGLDRTNQLMDAIGTGRAVKIEHPQVQHYNSLQAQQAHRFVIDPDGKFDVARAVMFDRLKAGST